MSVVAVTPRCILGCIAVGIVGCRRQLVFFIGFVAVGGVVALGNISCAIVFVAQAWIGIAAGICQSSDDIVAKVLAESFLRIVSDSAEFIGFIPGVVEVEVGMSAFFRGTGVNAPDGVVGVV